MPDLKQQLEFIKENTDARIKSINSRRIFYRRRAFMAFISTTFIAAVTTILLALNRAEWAGKIRVIALVLTTIITLINAFNGFYNHKEMWVANNTALNKLYALKFLIEYEEKGGDMTTAKVEGFKGDYETALNELNQNWLKTRTETQPHS